jgi:hypothetical protein
MQEIREFLENRHVAIYFHVVIIAAAIALLIPGITVLEPGVNPALALMLFVTFLQVPLADLRSLRACSLSCGLIVANFTGSKQSPSYANAT